MWVCAPCSDNPLCAGPGCDGSIVPGKGLTWRGEEEPILLQTCSCAGSPQQDGHPGAGGHGSCHVLELELFPRAVLCHTQFGIPRVQIFSWARSLFVSPFPGAGRALPAPHWELLHIWLFLHRALWDCCCASGHGECAENCRELSKCSLILKMSEV